MPFLNPDEMSGPMQGLYLLIIFGSIGGALYFFYKILVLDPEQEDEERKKKLEMKRMKKHSKKVE